MKPDDEGEMSDDPGASARTGGLDRRNPGSNPATKPFTGGYYWLPTPTSGGIAWSVVTCRDLGCRKHAGHDADLWPRLMAPLAEVWGKDALAIRRKLALSYTALPRGRVTRPGTTFLVLHGDDSPATGWQEMVIRSFCLTGRGVQFVFDEHETQLPGHPEKFASIFGPLP